MLLITHIIIALSSILTASWALILPSRFKLRLSIGLVISTIASGTVLVVSTHAPLQQACTTGLLYLAGVSVIIIAASRKLAAVRTK